jgi:solute carrier family 25 (mitochondrial oxoglutarate transporter), member 11
MNMFSASMVAALASSFACLPFDNAKTKLQKMEKDNEGKYPYKNIIDALTKTIKREGFTHMWRGYFTFYVRLAPHSGITLICQDFLMEHVNSWKNNKH